MEFLTICDSGGGGGGGDKSNTTDGAASSSAHRVPITVMTGDFLQKAGLPGERMPQSILHRV